MSWYPPELEARLRTLITPTGADVTRAKRSILDALASGTPQPSLELHWSLVDAENISRQAPRDATLDVQPGADVTAVDASDSFVLRERFRLAGQIALAELAAEGLLTGVDGPANVYATIPVRSGSTSGGVRIAIGMPTLASGYQLSRRFQAELLPILDVDIFVADLAGLGLDGRGLQCIREALAAFRRGLYLSCVNLIGAVSEGAWWSLAERLRGHSAALDAALDDDRAGAAHLLRVTADVLAEIKGMRNVAAELYAHATYVRELRNYGVHPRGADPEASEEHAFTESGCAVLLLSTHRYLERLASLPVGTTE